jgi:hypothetical protein
MGKRVAGKRGVFSGRTRLRSGSLATTKVAKELRLESG